MPNDQKLTGFRQVTLSSRNARSAIRVFFLFCFTEPRFSRKRTREDHRVALGVSEPILPVSVFAELTWPENRYVHNLCSRNRGVKLFEFKPKNHSVTIRLERWVTKRAMVMLYFPLVKLQDKSIAVIESLVFIATMSACEAEQFLVPAATRFDIPDTD